jgi:hypothetical protein
MSVPCTSDGYLSFFTVDYAFAQKVIDTIAPPTVLVGVSRVA